MRGLCKSETLCLWQGWCWKDGTGTGNVTSILRGLWAFSDLYRRIFNMENCTFWLIVGATIRERWMNIPEFWRLCRRLGLNFQRTQTEDLRNGSSVKSIKIWYWQYNFVEYRFWEFCGKPHREEDKNVWSREITTKKIVRALPQVACPLRSEHL